MSVRRHWVTFDCFGTLVDWQAGFAAALRPVAGERTGDLVRAYHVHERLVEGELPHRAYKDVLVTALARAAAEQDVPLPRSAAHVLGQAWASMRVFDDVEAMLAELRVRGYRLGVLTNCDDDLFEITHRSFRTPFDFVLTSERVRGYKPAPWHFRGFERLTGVARNEWVHVAASVHHDIGPARALGIQHLWLDREGGRGPVQSGIDVVAAVDRLRGALAGQGSARPGALACC